MTTCLITLQKWFHPELKIPLAQPLTRADVLR